MEGFGSRAMALLVEGFGSAPASLMEGLALALGFERMLTLGKSDSFPDSSLTSHYTCIIMAFIIAHMQTTAYL